MNTQLKIYEELKMGKKLNRKDIQELIAVAYPHACSYFDKVSKLEHIEVVWIEVIKPNGRRFLVEYLRYKA